MENKQRAKKKKTMIWHNILIEKAMERKSSFHRNIAQLSQNLHSLANKG